jgi:hypothetical protein
MIEIIGAYNYPPTHQPAGRTGILIASVIVGSGSTLPLEVGNHNNNGQNEYHKGYIACIFTDVKMSFGV